MKIYTKAGDGGNTYLLGGGKVRKDDPVVEALGGVDELNACLGWAESLSRKKSPAKVLPEIQRLLHVLGTDIASPPKRKESPSSLRILPRHAEELERRIDGLAASLPPLSTFILPGGSPAGSALHLARTVCRRVERRVAALHKKKRASKDALIFLNRLSDFLFLLARSVNIRDGAAEVPWRPR